MEKEDDPNVSAVCEIKCMRGGFSMGRERDQNVGTHCDLKTFYRNTIKSKAVSFSVKIYCTILKP